MKQHITRKQLNGLSKKGKDRLREWNGDPRKMSTRTTPNPEEQYLLDIYADLPLLSIGKMIEFLDEHVDHMDLRLWEDGKSWVFTYPNCKSKPHYNPCDALWEAVKEVLEE